MIYKDKNKRRDYICKICDRKSAYIKKATITHKSCMRVEFYCDSCNNKFEATANKKIWNEIGWPLDEVKKIIAKIKYKINKEIEAINKRIAAL